VAGQRPDAVLGLIPAGRGNDLARVLAIPAGPEAAVRLLAGGTPRPVDLIGVSIPGQPELAVAGSVYAGLPSVAGEIGNATRWLTGPAVYPVAALRVLAAWHPVTFGLEPAGAGPAHFPGYAVVIANIAYFGAGMMVAPPARIDDGLLDIVTMRDGPRLAFLRVLLRIRAGTHVALPQVALDRAATVTLTMDRALPVAADGEVLPWASPLPAGTPLTVRALPGLLNVIAPPAAR
jgi:diacylglycerol kinase (ATP)